MDLGPLVCIFGVKKIEDPLRLALLGPSPAEDGGGEMRRPLIRLLRRHLLPGGRIMHQTRFFSR